MPWSICRLSAGKHASTATRSIAWVQIPFPDQSLTSSLVYRGFIGWQYRHPKYSQPAHISTHASAPFHVWLAARAAARRNRDTVYVVRKPARVIMLS
ncbi:hypothetical protein PC116_g31885 [Phytophthora cactorum]|nr:hypothetical protein PC116_g31885 [Phytophthora cactorum]